LTPVAAGYREAAACSRQRLATLSCRNAWGPGRTV